MTLCGDTLVAVDQHAADERVQLEKLQQALTDNQQCSSTGGIHCSSALEPTQVGRAVLRLHVCVLCVHCVLRS